MRLGVLVLVVGCASSSGALQAPPPVACPSGVAAWVDGTSYPTVQAALDAASPAGPARVDVCPGTWVENLELPFVGDWTIAGVGPARPALDGGLAGPVLSSEDSALTLVDLVLQNGRNDESGGGLWLAGGSLEALRVDLRDNAAGEGGGAAIYDADVTLSGCRFERNVADWGESGGGGLLVTQLHAGHQATIADTTFVANEAIVGGAGGGARLTAFADAGVAMDRVLFEANVADAGAAMFAQAEDGVLAARLARAVVRRHDNGQTGEGTLYVFASPGAAVSLDVVGGQIADNVARASPALLAIGLPSGSPGEARVRLSGTAIVRNAALGPPSGVAPTGAVETAGHAVAVLRDVNLGAGASDNAGGDLAACATPLGAHTRGWIAAEVGRCCP